MSPVRLQSPYRLGPLRLIKRGNVFHIRGTIEGKLIRITTGTDDLVRARAALDSLHAEYETGWRLDSSGDVSWREVAKWVCARQRVSAKERGIPFQIDAIDVYREMERMNFRCAVSGIPLSRTCGPNREPDPWSASLDRIENRQGYIQDNFRVVCLAANLAMNRWGYDVLLRLARSVSRSADQVMCDEILAHSKHAKEIAK